MSIAMLAISFIVENLGMEVSIYYLYFVRVHLEGITHTMTEGLGIYIYIYI